MPTVAELIEHVGREARRAEFPVDAPVYEKAGKDPLVPVLYAGNLEAPVAIFARDLGKDEVAAGQPLIGAGGRLVREGILKVLAGETPSKADRTLQKALDYAILTNTVPYKPPGNKAYPDRVKERFRPFLAELLVDHWKGNRVISLGTEAFQWFARYAEPGAADVFWKRDDRYEAELPCELVVKSGSKEKRKAITLCPLPHPSPLNQRWYAAFPELLAARLRAAGARRIPQKVEARNQLRASRGESEAARRKIPETEMLKGCQ